MEPQLFKALLLMRAYKAKLGDGDEFKVEAVPHATSMDPPVTARKQDGDSSTESRENMDKARRLQTATNNAGLDELYRNKFSGNAKDVQKW